MQRGRVNREGQRTLNKLRGLLCGLALRALRLEATTHVRRRGFAIQARLQRVDRAEKHVEQVLTPVLAVIEKLAVSSFRLVAEALVRLFFLTQLAKPMLDHIGFIGHQLFALVGFM